MSSISNFIPDIIIPGAPKAGTSALHHFLSQHPKIFDTEIKEPHTYSLSTRHATRPTNRAPNLTIDASTSYFACPYAADRIWQDNPSAKVIFILRDPLDRIVSHYRWILTRAVHCKPFRQEILCNLDEFKEIGFQQWKGNWKNYLDFSLYSKHIQKWSKFDRQIVYQNDLTQKPQHVCNEVFDFLGLDEHEIKKEKVNSTIDYNLKPKNNPFSRLKTLITSDNPIELILARARQQKLARLQKTAVIGEVEHNWIEAVIQPIVEDSMRYSALGIDSSSFNTLRRFKNALQQP